VVSKTPFSATISIKCSLAKVYKNSSTESDKQFCQSSVVNENAASVKSEDPMDLTNKLESEILKLKLTIKGLENTVIEQKQVLDVKSKQLKDSSKSAEDQGAELREELLKVKRERNRLGSKMKLRK
jgi:hypothetical protein